MTALILHPPEGEQNVEKGIVHVHDISTVHGVVKNAVFVNMEVLASADSCSDWGRAPPGASLYRTNARCVYRFSR